MNVHFREPDTFVLFTPETRKRIEKAIENLVALLDQCDGDSDFEDNGDNEPWLATVYAQGQEGAYPDGEDREFDNSDDEKTGDSEPYMAVSAVHWQDNGDRYSCSMDYEGDSHKR